MRANRVGAWAILLLLAVAVLVAWQRQDQLRSATALKESATDVPLYVGPIYPDFAHRHRPRRSAAGQIGRCADVPADLHPGTFIDRPNPGGALTADARWAVLTGRMSPDDTLRSYEVAQAGGHRFGGVLALRGNCFLGQLDTWDNLVFHPIY